MKPKKLEAASGTSPPPGEQAGGTESREGDGDVAVLNLRSGTATVGSRMQMSSLGPVSARDATAELATRTRL